MRTLERGKARGNRSAHTLASLQDLPDDAWVADGCRKARELLEAGLPYHAVDVLDYIERKALGPLRRPGRVIWRERKRVFAGCFHKHCDGKRVNASRPWCWRHRPRFDRTDKQVHALLVAMWCVALRLPPKVEIHRKRARRAAA